MSTVEALDRMILILKKAYYEGDQYVEFDEDLEELFEAIGEPL